MKNSDVHSYACPARTNILNKCLCGGAAQQELGDEKSTTVDEVNHPPHYGAGTYEVINVAEAWEEMFGMGFRLLQVIKYITRAGRKGGVNAKTDLQKARWYLDREIAKRWPEK